LTFTSSQPLRVQPLLTPDNYHENVKKLIDSARERLYLQNQYIKPRTDSPEAFRELYQAVAQKVAQGLDVRIILRREGNVRRMIESLKTVGIRTDGDHLRLLAGCHNKGIVIDSQTVLVGSHNWSGDGAVFNRDASLILYDPKAAAHFDKVFRYDWDNRAHPSVPTERGAVALLAPPADAARGAAAVPRGMRRVSWEEFFGD
jgi:phosphatidylserine/phosphatidylglycerophosphate/cardiolipin synthase-like enzyme